MVDNVGKKFDEAEGCGALSIVYIQDKFLECQEWASGLTFKQKMVWYIIT